VKYTFSAGLHCHESLFALACSGCMVVYMYMAFKLFHEVMVNLLSNMAHNTSLSISSYNSRGVNDLEKDIISDIRVWTDSEFLQEHCMTEEQLGELGLIMENVSYTAVWV